MLFSLLFVFPFYREFCGSGHRTQSWVKAVYVVFAFAAGAYSESISLAMLFIAFCLAVGGYIQKRKVPLFLAAALVTAILGYVFLMLSPSELSCRAGEFSLSAIARSFEYAVELTKLHLGKLYCAFMLIFAVAIETELTKPKGERDFRPVVFAAIAFLGGLVSIAVVCVCKVFPEQGYVRVGLLDDSCRHSAALRNVRAQVFIRIRTCGCLGGAVCVLVCSWRA